MDGEFYPAYRLSRHQPPPKVHQHRLYDGLESIPQENRFWCSCGVDIHPDCDISSVSTSNAWMEHLEVMEACPTCASASPEIRLRRLEGDKYVYCPDDYHRWADMVSEAVKMDLDDAAAYIEKLAVEGRM